MTTTKSLVAAIVWLAGLAQAQQFGETFDRKQAVALDQIMDKREQLTGKTVIAKAEVRKVCKKKGCWMTLINGKDEIRVTFKNYGIFVPQKLVGKRVIVRGTLGKKTMSVAEVAHLLEDEGLSKEAAKAKAKAKSVYHFVADGVQVAS